MVVQAWPSTLRWSSYEATPEPTSVAASHDTVTGTPPVPIPRPVGSVTRGGLATGALVSERTVIGALPVTTWAAPTWPLAAVPVTVATTWAVPGLVATNCPLASIVPIGAVSDQASPPAGIGT